ncbi:MAG: acyltransferase domain-containing protein, partial [Planctomycetes bacterium]|nr:acyltransferase domain-containing protein [Planctomycetota bacterium]
MGRQLFETQPLFRDTLLKCDEILRAYLAKPLLQVLYGEGQESGLLNETRYTQPLLFSFEYALAALWQSWGVQPDFVMGHSVGEYVAACVAKVFSLEDGLRLIAERARLMHELPGDGMMAVIFASGSRVAPLLEDHHDSVSIAAYNGPENTVISGQSAVVSQLMEDCQSQGIRSQALNVSHAFHSPLMDPMLDEFQRLAEQLTYRPPETPIISNLTGDILIEKTPDAAYWRQHVRSPVQFVRGLQRLEAEDPDAAVEVGPSTTLLAMGRRCLPDARFGWFPSLRSGRHDWSVILEALGELYVRGTEIDWQAYDQPWSHRRLSLPTYPFQRSRLWHRPGAARQSRGHRTSPREASHPLLGAPLPTPMPQRLFEVNLSASSPAYLVDHQVQGAPVVPAAAYLEQALAAARFVLGEGYHSVENVSIQQALVLPQGASQTVQVSVSPEDNGQCRFEIFSAAATTDSAQSDWTLHACGVLRRGPSDSQIQARVVDIQAIRGRMD